MVAAAFASHLPQAHSVTVYGSVARDTHEAGSDVDVLLVDDDAPDEATRLALAEQIDSPTGLDVQITHCRLDEVSELAQQPASMVTAAVSEGVHVSGVAIGGILTNAVAHDSHMAAAARLERSKASAVTCLRALQEGEPLLRADAASGVEAALDAALVATGVGRYKRRNHEAAMRSLEEANAGLTPDELAALDRLQGEPLSALSGDEATTLCALIDRLGAIVDAADPCQISL